jgi:Ala-tRNA(Pro) deacylase
VTGTILPFSFNPELELIVDPSLLENQEIYFNAARLDCSMVLMTSDYIVVANPRLGHISESRGEPPKVASSSDNAFSSR